MCFNLDILYSPMMNWVVAKIAAPKLLYHQNFDKFKLHFCQQKKETNLLLK